MPFLRLTLLFCLLLVSCEQQKKQQKVLSKTERQIPQNLITAEETTVEGLVKKNDTPIQTRVKAFQHAIAKMNFEELEDLIRNPPELLQNSYFQNEILESIFTRLAELDPKRALALIDLVHFSKQPMALSRIFRQWAKDDFESAYEEAKLLEKGSIRRNALWNSLITLADSDPRRAFDLAWAEDGIESYRPLLTKLMKISPVEAYQKAQLLDHGLFISIMHSTFREELSFQNQDEFKALYMAAQDQMIRYIALDALSNSVYNNSALHLLEGLDTFLSEGDLARLNKGLLPQEAKENPQAYGEQLIAHEDWYALQKLTIHHGKGNPQEALKLAEQIGVNHVKLYSISTIMRNWAKTDAESVLDYALNNLHNNDIHQYYSDVALSAPHTVGEETMEKVLSHPDITSPSLGNYILKGWASNDLVNTSAYLATLPPDTPHLTEYYRTVAFRYQNHQNEGVEWLNQIEHEDSRNAATESLIRSLAHANIDETIQLVNEMEASEQRDYAVVGLSDTLKFQNPELALDWADTISNDSIRWENIKDLYYTLRNNDMPAAQEWANNNLSQEQLELLSQE